jgi:protease-4
MTNDADEIVERRRLRRRASFWRFGAVIAALLAIVAVVTREGAIADGGGYVPHVARVAIEGVITDDDKLLKLIERVKDSSTVQAVILDINSPGGTTTGGEALYDAITRLRAEKPVVAVCGTIATSAAYMTAVATDRVFVRGSTITGSVGVIMQWAEVKDGLAELGIKVDQVKSGPLKAVPNPFEDLSPEGRAVAQEMIDDSQRWFLGLVTDRRKIAPAEVPGLTEGRVYNGRQAVALKLVDEVGAEREARDWLEKERSVPANLRVREWKPREDRDWTLLSLARGAAAALGVSTPLIDAALRSVDAARLDGLVSLWHPSTP